MEPDEERVEAKMEMDVMRDGEGGGRKGAGGRQPLQKKGETAVGSDRKASFTAFKAPARLFSSDSKGSKPNPSYFSLTPDSSTRSRSPSFRPPSPHASFQVTRVDLTDSEVTRVSETMADKARLRFTQAALSLTAKKVSDLRNYNPPLPELEAVCLAVLAVLIRVNPASSVFGQSYTWKSFLGCLQQPTQAVRSLKSAAVCVETGVIDRGRNHIVLVQSLKERLKKVNERNLLDYESSGTGLLLYDYLTSLINFAEILQEEKGHVVLPVPFLVPEAQMPSRTRLLTSLYSRIFPTETLPPSQ